MKRLVTLILAALLVLALFAGCGDTAGNKGATNGSTDGSAKSGDNIAGTEASAKPEATAEPEDPNYRFAVGKYETDADGWPLEKYVYELPFCMTDEVLTNMTTNFTPQYLPEDNYMGIPTYAEAMEMTGVNVEYNIIAIATFSETLSVNEAADNLDDIVAAFAAFHRGTTLAQCIEDELVVDLYKYKEYMPNYCWEIKNRSKNESLMASVNRPSATSWAGFTDFYSEPVSATGYFIREDFMEKLGLGTATSFWTFDEFHDILTAIKVGIDGTFPLILFSNIDGQPYNWNAYNTSPYSGGILYSRVIDGKVYFNGTTDDDLELMTLINKWYSEGLVDPNFASYKDTASESEALTTDRLATAMFNPSEVAGWEASSINPDCRWQPINRLRKDTNQIIHWNLALDELGGSGSSIAASCENIPLACSWIDWCYSDFGAEWMNWGPEGWGWEYTEDGKKQWKDIVLNSEAGVGWITMCWFFNPMDAGINDWTRNYYYPGGDRFLAMFDVWNYATDNYFDGAYDFPATIKLSDEDNEEVLSIRTDLNTYFSENYVMFVDGSKSLAEWNSFQKNLISFGYDRIQEIYQQYYDEYLKNKA